MKRHFRFLSFVIHFAAGLVALASVARARELTVLIVTGQNNHYWPHSSFIVEQIFDQSPLFEADRLISPGHGEDLSGFNPNFAGYDIICLDYNGERWPTRTEAALQDFVASGGGLVVFHAADNAFADWPAYNEMIGLGGWGGRNENAGPYVYWRDGHFVRDSSPGKAGSHGRQLEFEVVTRAPDHPIMRGLPTSWLHTRDELYSRLRGPAKNLEILATAEQDPAEGGTGHQEPILMTVRYGQGRVFHSAMGHVGAKYFDSVRGVGFVTTLLRGAEWAATGQVTQPVPADFPTATATSIRTELGPDLELPNALIIGDSISIGYTPVVEGLLAGKVNIHHPLNDEGSYANCEGTTKGVAQIDAWLGDRHWDVIHFNFGLHDLKHVDPVTGRNSRNPDDPQQADLSTYEANLRQIVARLKKTGALLIFATTTPFPDDPGGPLRHADQPAQYNAIARRIMEENGIMIDDLHRFVEPRMEELQLPRNVHFKVTGYRALAEQVAGRIRRALGL